MNTTIRHLMAPWACAAALCLPAHAETIPGSANATTVIQGASATVEVTVNLASAVDLLGLDLAATWQTGALSVNLGSVQMFGRSLASFTAAYDPLFEQVASDDYHLGITTGTLGAAPFSLPAGLSTISFSVTGLAAGTHLVTYALSLTDSNFNNLAADFSAPVNVSAVPEANPAVMLAAGLAVMGLLARRRRA